MEVHTYRNDEPDEDMFAINFMWQSFLSVFGMQDPKYKGNTNVTGTHPIASALGLSEKQKIHDARLRKQLNTCPPYGQPPPSTTGKSLV